MARTCNSPGTVGGRRSSSPRGYHAVGADGFVTGSQTGDAFIERIFCTANGTLAAIKDGSGGATVITPGAMTAGQVLDCGGVTLPDGIYVDWTSGAFVVSWGRGNP